MRVHHAGERHHAAGYVGPRPTFGPGEPVLEAYLLDFSGDLYGEQVEVEFIDFIRPDHAFDTPGGARGADGKRTASRRAPSCAAVDADDPMRRFTLGAALADRALDCGKAGC